MSEPINIYCDESCHLEHDGQPLMVLGAVWCRTDKTAEMAKRLRELKAKHRMPERYELKWTAFLVKHEHERRKFTRRYEAAQKC